ncbi:putative WD40 repeat protein [Tieghemostelium lacteum]|uniref:Putative WD40 repeat protein n=1 Tax=Tieghemostelium lacteum TaxID=361077 RepID=A0A151ZSF5_TIELA|nr:putative WD40 repeat protein [Tieghemostelium lacteum]|eukprot:KYQ96714.1 putative WD40 repeat protein [Tieghemostelium lacteum]
MTSIETPYHFLPYISVQYDWQLAYKQDTDNFWISYKNELKSTIHGSVSTRKLNDKLIFEPNKPEFKLSSDSDDKNVIQVSYNGSNKMSIYSTDRIYKVLGGKKRITSMGVSNLGELGVYGSSDGTLEVFETSDGQVRRKLDGHVGDVDLAMFFPSGKVLLSGAGDGRLKVWDALEGTCAVTLMGHGGGITSAGLIDKGRNLISTSRDGSARLWDLPTSSTIATLTKLPRPINQCYVADGLLNGAQSNQEKKDQREFGTDGKAVILASEEGFLQIIDVVGKSVITQLSLSEQQSKSAFNACTVHRNYIIGGDHDGNIHLWDKNNYNTPLTRLQFTNSPIHQIVNSPNNPNCIWVTSGDGYVFQVNLDTFQIQTSLTGIDTDVVTSFNVVNDQIFTTSRDSFIRCYKSIQ